MKNILWKDVIYINHLSRFININELTEEMKEKESELWNLIHNV